MFARWFPPFSSRRAYLLFPSDFPLGFGFPSLKKRDLTL